MKTSEKVERSGDRDEPTMLTNNEDLTSLSPISYVPDQPYEQTTDLELYECSLDGISALRLPGVIPKAKEEALIQKFLSGLRKLFSPKYNWTLIQQLRLSTESCIHCRTCDDSCPVYVSSGRRNIYRPTYRLELLQALKRSYIDHHSVSGKPVSLTWSFIAGLAELAYRCTLCRRCALVCPMGVDNALITRELRKLFSQEMGIAPQELHEQGTVRQLVPGCIPVPVDQIKVEDRISKMLGREISLPFNKTGVEAVVLYSIFEEPERVKYAANAAIIMNAAGIDWTFSEEADCHTNNFGVWYDDIQFMRIASRQSQAARKLGAKKLIMGEWCGHASNALVNAERVVTGDTHIGRETILPILEEIVNNGRLALRPEKLNFPITLHDPCSLVRQMGIIQPQRTILKRICSDFREMNPNGVSNYCCGGGSGLVMITTPSLSKWREEVAGRMKVQQILEVFRDVLDMPVNKLVCAPCYSCRMQINNLLDHYGLRKRYHIHCCSLTELVLTAMADIKVQPDLFSPVSSDQLTKPLAKRF